MTTPLQHLRAAITNRAITISDRIRELRSEPMRLRTSLHILKPTLMMLPSLGPTDRFEIDSATGVTYLTIWLYELESMRDPRLVQTLEAFTEEPWITDSTADVEASSTPHRWYSFHGRFPNGHADTWGKPLYHPTIRVSVSAAVRADSPSCRRVQVRTERIEMDRPIFEIQCD